MTSLTVPSDRLNDAGITGAAFGLVPSSTSDTQPPDRFEIDRRQSRLKRMSKGVKTGARLHEEESRRGGRRCYTVMITATYATDSDYEPRHISSLLKCIREWHRRLKIQMRYVWVLELTKAGRPHYHVLLWLPRGLRLPKPDKRGWWPHGSTRIEGAQKPVGYLAKYASKLAHSAQEELQRVYQGLPKGSRLHGCGGLTAASASERRWWLSPIWVRKAWGPDLDPRPAPGGGWGSRVTGEWLSSPYRVIIEGSRVFIAPRTLGPEWWSFMGITVSGSGAVRGSECPQRRLTAPLPDAASLIQSLERYNSATVRYPL